MDVSYIYWLDLFGTAVFAISGALAAGRKNLDLFGVIVLGLVTAVGGGTLRDATLGATPVFWVVDPVYIIVASTAALITVVLARLDRIPHGLLVKADALGLATFTVIGAEKALSLGFSPVIALVTGVMTGCFGGMIRDLLCGEIPLILQKEIYATAALFGAGVYVGVGLTPLPTAAAIWSGLLAALLLRLAAIRWHLQLPVFTTHR